MWNIKRYTAMGILGVGIACAITPIPASAQCGCGGYGVVRYRAVGGGAWGGWRRGLRRFGFRGLGWRGGWLRRLRIRRLRWRLWRLWGLWIRRLSCAPPPGWLRRLHFVVHAPALSLELCVRSLHPAVSSSPAALRIRARPAI